MGPGPDITTRKRETVAIAATAKDLEAFVSLGSIGGAKWSRLFRN